MKCETCGSNMIFSPEKNSLFCSNCSNQKVINTETAINKKTLNQNLELLTVDSTIVHCESCGADSAIPTNTSSSMCSYCSSPIIKTTIKGINRPNNIIPFVITKSQSQANVKSWLSTRWFAPNALKEFSKTNGMNEVKGCYIPFWCFDTDTDSQYTGERGTYHYRTKTRIVDGKTETYQEQYTEWKFVTGELSHNFRDELDLAQNTIPNHLIDDLEPWNFKKSSAFNENFLLGFETLLANINVKTSWSNVKARIQQSIANDAKRDIGGDDQRLSTLNVDYSQEKFNQLVLPLWIGAYKFQNKTYRICVNGQTGKIDGERPYSIIKICAVVIPSISIFIIGLGYYGNIPEIIEPFNKFLHFFKII